MSSIGSASLDVNYPKKTVRAEVKDVVVTDFAAGCAAAAVVATAAMWTLGGRQSTKK